MRRTNTLLLTIPALALMSMGIYKNAISLLVSQNDIQAAVNNYLLDSYYATTYDSWLNIRPEGLKLSATERAAQLPDLLKRAKELVSSKAFKDSYTIAIEKNKNAYDYKHNDTLQSQTGLAYNNLLTTQQAISGYQTPDMSAAKKAMMQQLDAIPVSAFTQAIAQQIINIKSELQDNDKTPADKKDLEVQLKTKQDLLALSKTNPTEFKKKAIDQLYPDQSKIDGEKNAADKEFQDKLQELKNDMAEEQKNYDKYKLEAVLPARLKAFIDEAKTVDYDATVVRGRFTNPEYERKSKEWKYYYRMGKEPMQVAVSFAEQWLKELKK